MVVLVCGYAFAQCYCIDPTTSIQIDLTLEAEELFPTLIRRRFVTRTKVLYPNKLGLYTKFLDAWGAARWDSLDNIRKHTQGELVRV